MNNNILISAGDISGDIHAANLIKEIKKLYLSNIENKAEVYAVGGNQLKTVADTFIEDIVNLNAFGFFPIKQVLFLKNVFKKIQQILVDKNIKKVILVDYYGFNIHIAKAAHELKIPVYYFIAPQVWASRKYRIKNIAKYVDVVFPFLPFEKEMYEKENIKVFFEGNPLIDLVPSESNQQLSIRKEQLVIGLFAGSRKNTILRHLPVILDTVKILKEKINAKFILFSLEKLDYEIPDYIEVKTGKNFEERKDIDIAICPSGTVSLENALMGIPMVVMYKLSNANYWLARMLINVKYITLANILLNKEIVPECIQHNATPEKISNKVLKILQPDNYVKVKKELQHFRDMLGTKGVYSRVAQKIINLQ
ncbi:MAG: lipid-A-disaccharide synthase [Elusimicrobia bacterium]|nr:lipid-A-disaccharide synthase [Elusimicrobiota bacterium]